MAEEWFNDIHPATAILAYQMWYCKHQHELNNQDKLDQTHKHSISSRQSTLLVLLIILNLVSSKQMEELGVDLWTSHPLLENSTKRQYASSIPQRLGGISFSTMHHRWHLKDGLLCSSYSISGFGWFNLMQ